MRSDMPGENGFTLIELMTVVSIMLIVLAISSFVFLSEIPTVRLRGAAQSLAATLQFIKVRAVASNRYAWFHADPANRFYTGFVDESSFGTIQPSEYAQSNLDMPDTSGGTPGFFLPAGVSFGLPAGYSSGAGPDGIPYPGASATIVNAPGNYVGFRSTAIPVVNFVSNATPSSPVVIFLTNSKGEGRAVSIHITGRIKTFQWYGGSWR